MAIFLIVVSCIILGYLFGSIPTSVLIGKIFFHKDVRDYGSKNAGGTNAGRVFGKKVGLIVILLDIIKTIIPIYTAYCVLAFTSLNQYGMGDYGYIITAFCCLLGHCFPLFAQFKGGKAVSSFAAICIATNWLLTIVGLLLFLLILKLKKYVSLSSICTSIFLSLFSLLIIYVFDGFGMILFPSNIYYFILLASSSILLTIRHKGNIVRLIHHEERKITWMK